MKIIPKILSITLTLVLASCSVPNTPIERLARQDVLNAAGVGAFVGYVIGGEVGERNDIGREKGQLIGAGIGALSGAAVGKIAGDRRKKYASDSEFLDAEINSAQRAVVSKQSAASTLKGKLSETRQEISSLERRHRSNQDVSSAVSSQLADVNRTIASNQALMDGYKSSIRYVDQVLASTKKNDTSGMENRRSQLLDKRSRLQQQLNDLYPVQNSFIAERKRLERLSRTAGGSGASSGSNSSDPLPFGLSNPLKNLNIPNADNILPFSR